MARQGKCCSCFLDFILPRLLQFLSAPHSVQTRRRIIVSCTLYFVRVFFPPIIFDRPAVSRAQGTGGFEKHMDHLMELSEYMVDKIKASPDKFYLLVEPEMVNVSFWYVPKRLRNVPHSTKRAEILGQVSPACKPEATPRGYRFAPKSMFWRPSLNAG